MAVMRHNNLIKSEVSCRGNSGFFYYPNLNEITFAFHDNNYVITRVVIQTQRTLESILMVLNVVNLMIEIKFSHKATAEIIRELTL